MTVEYEDGKPDHLERVLVSCQYTENKKLEAGNFLDFLPFLSLINIQNDFISNLCEILDRISRAKN